MADYDLPTDIEVNEVDIKEGKVKDD